MNIKMNKLTLAMTLALGLSVVGCTPTKSFEEYVAIGQQSYDANNFSDAIVNLKNAIRLEPENAHARYLLASAYLELGDILSGEKEFERAKELGLDDNLLLPGMAKTYLELRQFDKVYQIVLRGNHLSDDAYIRVLTYAGISAQGENKQSNSEDYFAQANAIDANSKYSKLGQAWLNYGKGEFAAASAKLTSVMSEYKDFSEGFLLQGHLHLAGKAYAEAVDVYQKYVKLHPQSFSASLLLTNALLENKQLDKAQQEIDLLLKVNSEHPIVNYYQSLVMFKKEQFNDAKSFAQNALQADPTYLQARLIAGISSFQLKEFEQALSYLAQFNNVEDLNHPARKFFVAAKLQLGYVDDAIEMLSDVSDLDPDNLDLLQSATSEFARLGEVDASLALLAKAKEAAPDNANIIAQKGTLLVYKGDQSGQSDLLRAITLDPTLYQAKASLVTSYMRGGEYDKAMMVITELKGDKQSESLGLLLEGVLFAKQEKPEQAKQSLQTVLDSQPENVAALFNLGLLADQVENHIEAENYYQRVLIKNPNHQGAIKRLSSLYAKRSDNAGAIKFYTSLTGKHPESVNAVIALAYSFNQTKQFDKAIESLKNFGSKQSKNARYWLNLGDSYLYNNQLEESITSFKELLKMEPNSYVAHLRLIGLLEMTHQYKEGRRIANQALAKYPNNNTLLMLSANMDLIALDKPAALAKIQKLSESRYEHFYLDKLKALVSLADKDYKNAVENFASLYEKRPSGVNAMQLARSLKFNGQTNEAANTLESYLEKVENNHKVRVLLADLYMRIDRTKALKHFQILNESVKGNPLILNNLSALHLDNQKVDLAIKYGSEAYSMRANSPDIIDTYGEALIAGKQYDQAIEILETAMNKGYLADNSYILLAKAYIAKGEDNKVTLLLPKVTKVEIANQIITLNK